MKKTLLLAVVALVAGIVASQAFAAKPFTQATGDIYMSNPSQQATFDALHAGLEAALDIVRPGVTGADVFEAAIAATRKAGLPRFARHHVGYGIGLEPAEPPRLAPDGGALEMGMVLRVETPYYVAGEAGLNVKDTVLVTRTGTHGLNRSHRGLVVLD